MINEIGQALQEEGMVYTLPVDTTRGEEVQDLLETVCYAIVDAANLTEGKADIELLTSIVATYMISKNNDSIDEDSKPPSELFDDIVFPQLDNYVEPTVEEIPEDEQLTPVSA